nr:ankyrin repeat domain-containing protein [Kibdelosporangium sp. MJ126-NF4]
MRASLGPEALSSWARARRFAVPPSMVEEATARRLAGDWQGACAAARIDVTFRVDDVARTFGVKVADRLRADLAVLVPDLVRWHMPRLAGGLDTITPKQRIVLAGYGDDGRSGPSLWIRTPASCGPQRLTLGVSSLEETDSVQSWATSRYLWDSTHADELRVRCGGGDRAPFFNTDGTPADLPTADPGDGDLAARTEWLTVLQERGQLRDAFAAVEIELDDGLPELKRRYDYYDRGPVWQGVTLPLALSTLVDEVRRLGDWQRRDVYRFALGDYRTWVIIDVSRAVPVIRRVSYQKAEGLPDLPYVIAHRLPDLDLLRAGRIGPHALHPLVRSSLFPDLPNAKPVPRYEMTPVRVRCQGVWHLVEPRDGVLSGPHTEQEHRREQALQALGGTASGCFRARTAWAEGGTLPKHLRALRREIFGRARHGDTAGVIELLDAGIDVRVREGSQRTLLHYLHCLDHELLLRRLLALGLDLEARDQQQRTPLYTAICEGGSEQVVRALVKAGARTDVVDVNGTSLDKMIKRIARGDLDFLMDR